MIFSIDPTRRSDIVTPLPPPPREVDKIAGKQVELPYKDALCHALLIPLSSVRREKKNEGKWKQQIITEQNNK